MMNVEGALRAYLEKRIDSAIGIKVPDPRPPRFVTVEMTGVRAIGPGIDSVAMVADCWGASRSDAFALAASVKNEIESLGYGPVGWTSGIEPGSGGVSMAHYPDVETKAERYELAFSLVAHQ